MLRGWILRMNEIPLLKPLLLPSSIWARLSAKTDSENALPINLSTNVIERLKKDPVRAERLSALAASIWDHLAARRPGWGPWPDNTEDALAVSMILGVWIDRELNESILGLTEEEMKACRPGCEEFVGGESTPDIFLCQGFGQP